MLKNGKKNNADLEFFTIYDSKTESYREPMLAQNRFDMIRSLEGLYRDSRQATNQLITNAEDFALFKVGEFDRKTGLIVSTNHEHIINLHELRSSIRPQPIQTGIDPT